MLPEAESLLKNTLRMERKAGSNCGATALNLAGVLQTMGKFNQSLAYAQLAVTENILPKEEKVRTNQIPKNIRMLALSHMSCSKSLRFMGFPLKALRHLEIASEIISGFDCQEFQRLKRILEIQNENSTKESEDYSKFNVKCLELDSKQSAYQTQSEDKKKYRVKSHAQKSRMKSVRSSKDSSENQIYFYGSIGSDL